MDGTYIKVVGVKFDAIEGLQVIADGNRKTFAEAGIFADKHADRNTIFIGVPCTYDVKLSSS